MHDLGDELGRCELGMREYQLYQPFRIRRAGMMVADIQHVARRDVSQLQRRAGLCFRL